MKFPARLNALAKSILSGLLTKDPTKRLASNYDLHAQVQVCAHVCVYDHLIVNVCVCVCKYPDASAVAMVVLCLEILDSVLNSRISIHRLGGGVKDAEEVKAHPFFGSINFQELYDRKVWSTCACTCNGTFVNVL